MTCPACGADEQQSAAFAGVDRLLGTPGTFEVRVCRRCGSGVTHPPAGPAELAAFYPGTYGPYEAAAGLCVLTLPFAVAVDPYRGGGDQLHAIARAR